MLFFLLALVIFSGKMASYKRSFAVSFEYGKAGSDAVSTNEWIEFSNKIPASKEFTACQWIKPHYFNKNIAINLWSYCTIQTVGDAMQCIQMYLQPTTQSANRDLVVVGEMKLEGSIRRFQMDVKSFSHRVWAHFCWSVSSLTKEGKFYYNGNLLGIHTLKVHKNQTVIKGNSNTLDAAFIFGQEPDLMRGGYDKFQAFIGDLTELNIWSYLVGDNKIREMAQCKDWTKGSLVVWEKNSIISHNVIIKELEDASSLCIDNHRLVIFPQKVQYSRAKEVCEIHGGKLAIPKSQKVHGQFNFIIGCF